MPSSARVYVDDYLLVNAILKSGRSWRAFIENMLDSTAQIAKNMPMGTSNVQPWAIRKVWLSCVSLMTPTYTSPAPTNPAVLSYAGKTPIKYVITNAPSTLPTYIPARFSVVWASGNSSDAPYRSGPCLLDWLHIIHTNIILTYEVLIRVLN